MQVLRPEITETRGTDVAESFGARYGSLAEAEVPEPLTYPTVLVEWHDAWFDQDQADPEDFRTDYLVRTLGFLVSETPTVITVAHELLPDGDGFRAVTHIPIAIVEAIHHLAPADRRDV